MASYDRFTVTKSASGVSAYCRSTGAKYTSETRENLHSLVKEKEGSPVILRRKNRWMVFSEMPAGRAKRRAPVDSDKQLNALDQVIAANAE